MDESSELGHIQFKVWLLSDTRLVASHFKTPLNESNFSIENIENEWKSLKRLCTRNYPNIKSPLAFWQMILTYRLEEFSNVCLIAEICLTIGVSNSRVERGFSKLTHLLTDKRLSMSHTSMENCLLIAAPNDISSSENSDNED